MAQQKFRAASAALLALALLGAAAPAPVQAQGFEFHFGIGDDDRFERRLLRRPCLMTESGLRRSIRARGYTDVFLNVAHERRIEVRASKGSWVYLLEVNACTGRILDRTRLRRR